MTSAPAIGFEYRVSRWAARLSIVVAVLAVLAVASCALPLWLKFLSIAIVLIATWRSLSGTSRSSVAAVGLSHDNAWTVRLADHEDMPATLASFRVMAGVVLLRLRLARGGVQIVVLAPDNSDADIRRRLRMRLATLQLDASAQRV
ncbi:protein YgfX [Rhodanobacter sp. L36]|uniref:protein YgfX n=1 Tax=Rhodanobacter sp. L36 TaxID=1747221 RepID=UPI00131A89E4|nr:protein YgfX [Rhodanobacter sp. L36]